MVTLPLRANDVKHDNNNNKKAVSLHSSKRLSLNSLFLQSLGDKDGITPMVIIFSSFTCAIYFIFFRKQIARVNVQDRGKMV